MGLGRTEITMIVSQAVVILFFGLFTDYGKSIHPGSHTVTSVEISNEIQTHYPLF